MAQQPNTLLRVVIPLAAILIGIGVVVAVFTNTRSQRAPTAPGVPGTTGTTGTTGPTGAPSATGTTGVVAPTVTPAPSGAPGQPPAPPPTPAPAPTGPAAGMEGLRAAPVAPQTHSTIGSRTPRGTHAFEIVFSPVGAGVRAVTLADHFDTIERKDHLVVQREATSTGGAPEISPGTTLTPFGAVSIVVNGRLVDLTGFENPVDPQTGQPGRLAFIPRWRETAPGVFEASVINGQGQPVLRLTREFILKQNSYSIDLRQRAENLSGQPLTIRWVQFGPVDLYKDDAAYIGDRRRIRFGYVLAPAAQKGDPTVIGNDYLWTREDAIGGAGPSGQVPQLRPVWPNEDSQAKGFRLVWLGTSNRYFGAAAYPLVAAGAGPDAKVFAMATAVQRVLLDPAHHESMIGLQTGSAEIAVPSGGAADLSIGVYAGPLNRPDLERDAAAQAVNLDGLVVYNLGGPCGWCTFTFLTSLLLVVLKGIHSLVWDWGIAIMFLVLCVRLVLHPVTKWSQVRMTRFGKQMQAMAPKQKKIQEKYGSDPKKMREEMGRLWREEGVSPTGMLGCIPMFLQTPVWIALYATVFYFFPLRHTPAFYGVFQAIQPQSWPTWWFLGDLSEPDRFLYFGKVLFTIPMIGEVKSLNFLPFLLAIVFYVQQKYLTPPPTPGGMTPEQEQQQKIMKWMMVILFPLLMYGAPAGLTLYFIANSVLGIIESKYIRSHMDKYDKLNPPGSKPKKPGGFMARLQAMAEERQKQMQARMGQQPPGGRKRV